MKYLGVEVEENDKNKQHLEKRKRLALSSVARLKSLGIWSEYTNPYLKAHIYKTFIRPVLMYGMETINLLKTEVNGIRQIEGNIIKNMIGISNRCRTTNLLLALNIKDTRTLIEEQKTEFMIRLVKNNFTKMFIQELLDENELKHLWNCTEHIFDDELKTISEMKLICKMSKHYNDTETKATKERSEAVKEIKQALNEKENKKMVDKLFELIKFK